MSVHKSIPMLAAAVTLFGTSAPAYAFETQAPAGGGTPPAPVTVSHTSGSSDLAIGLAAGGIVVVVVGGGLAARQLRQRPSQAVQGSATISGS